MLTLMKIEEIAPPAEQTGVNTQVSIKIGKDDNGVDFKNLDWEIDLDAVDSTGKKFRLKRTYRIDLKRGVTAFRNDFAAWSGRKLTDYELSKFDAEQLMKGKPVKLVVRHRKEGKKTVAVIDRFLRTVIEQVPKPEEKDAAAVKSEAPTAPAPAPAATQEGNQSESTN